MIGDRVVEGATKTCKVELGQEVKIIVITRLLLSRDLKQAAVLFIKNIFTRKPTFSQAS